MHFIFTQFKKELYLIASLKIALNIFHVERCLKMIEKDNVER